MVSEFLLNELLVKNDTLFKSGFTASMQVVERFQIH